MGWSDTISPPPAVTIATVSSAPRLVQVAADDLRPFGRELQRGLAPLAARGAADQRNLVREPSRHVVPQVLVRERTRPTKRLLRIGHYSTGTARTLAPWRRSTMQVRTQSRLRSTSCTGWMLPSSSRRASGSLPNCARQATVTPRRRSARCGARPNAAWAMNQLVRRDGGVLTEFLERSRELATAQQSALAGDRDRAPYRDSRAPSSDDGRGRDRSRLPRVGCVGDDTYPDPDARWKQRREIRQPRKRSRVGRLTREADVASGFTADFETPTTPGAPAPKARPKLHLVPDEDEVRRRRAELEVGDQCGGSRGRAGVSGTGGRRAGRGDGRGTRSRGLNDELADAQRERRDAAKELRDARKAANGVVTRLDRLRRERG